MDPDLDFNNDASNATIAASTKARSAPESDWGSCRVVKSAPLSACISFENSSFFDFLVERVILFCFLVTALEREGAGMKEQNMGGGVGGLR